MANYSIKKFSFTPKA